VSILYNRPFCAPSVCYLELLVIYLLLFVPLTPFNGPLRLQSARALFLPSDFPRKSFGDGFTNMYAGKSCGRSLRRDTIPKPSPVSVIPHRGTYTWDVDDDSTAISGFDGHTLPFVCGLEWTEYFQRKIFRKDRNELELSGWCEHKTT
jgi:hypothetical protein